MYIDSHYWLFEWSIAWLQGYNPSIDSQHGVRGFHRECFESAHSRVKVQVAIKSGWQRIQASDCERNAWSDKQRDGSDEEDDEVLQEALHFHFQHQPQWWDLSRDGVEVLEEEQLAFRGFLPL